MRIQNNLMAMNTQRSLELSSNQGAKSMAKLSSGFRINSAADDAAGLSISEKMRSQIRGLAQASRNAQDGISLIQTAEGALGETQEILQRMRELAVQAGNDTNTDADRGEIQKEINQLTSEINRIGNTTEFNTQKLLRGAEPVAATGTLSGAPAAAGVYDAGTSEVFGSATAETAFNVSADFTGLTGASVAITVGGDTYTVGNAAIAGLGDLGDVGASQTYETVEDRDSAIIAAITGADDGSGGSLSDVATVTIEEGKIVITANTAATGTDVAVAVTAGADGSDDATALGFGTVETVAGVTQENPTPEQFTFDVTANFAAGDRIEVAGETFTFGDGTNGTIEIGTDEEATAANLATALNGLADYSAGASGATITLTQANASTDPAPEVTVMGPEGEGFTATLQIGSNQGQLFSLNIDDMRASALGVSGETGTIGSSDAAFVGGADNAIATGEFALDVSDSTKASAAITVVDSAIERVSAERSKLGAMQNRLEHTIKNLDTSAENMQSAESRIRDVDMAKEMMEFTKNNILQQAATAMLAQANQAPQAVLQLLR